MIVRWALSASCEQAGFAVLRPRAMQSILVETAFISNPREAGKQSDPPDQGRAVDGLQLRIKR